MEQMIVCNIVRYGDKAAENSHMSSLFEKLI